MCILTVIWLLLLSQGSALLSITTHIKAYQKSNVWERPITEQFLKKTPGHTHTPPPKKYWMSKGIQSGPLESTYLTGHSQAEPVLQLSVQLGTDALSPSLPVSPCFFIWTCRCRRVSISSHGCHQEEDADAQARQGERLG